MQSTMQNTINEINEWSANNNMKLNASKTKEMIISFDKDTPNAQPIIFNGSEIERVDNSGNNMWESLFRTT